jgi:hypothetical protein
MLFPRKVLFQRKSPAIDIELADSVCARSIFLSSRGKQANVHPGGSVAQEINGTLFFSITRSGVAVFIDLLSASITAARNGDGLNRSFLLAVVKKFSTS